MCDLDINGLDWSYLPSASLQRPSPNVMSVSAKHEQLLVEEEIETFLQRRKSELTGSDENNDDIDNIDDLQNDDDDISDVDDSGFKTVPIAHRSAARTRNNKTRIRQQRQSYRMRDRERR